MTVGLDARPRRRKVPVSTPLSPSPSSSLAELAGRPADAATLAILEQTDPAGLDAAGKVDYLVAVERVASKAAALHQAALSAIDVAANGELRRPADFDDDWARE